MFVMAWHLRHEVSCVHPTLSSHLWSQLQPVPSELFWAHWQSSNKLSCALLHSSVSGLSLKPRKLAQPRAREACKGEGVTATCSNPQLMGDGILWINAPSWHPSDEQFWGTFSRASQKIPSRIDPWLPRPLTNSVV